MVRGLLFLRAAPPLALAALAIAACAGARPVDVGLVMRVPEGLLDQASSVDLFVFDASLAKCDTKTGHASTIPDTAKRFPLDNGGCTGGASWCKTISLDEDGSTQLFVVRARAAAGILAEGCKAV